MITMYRQLMKRAGHRGDAGQATTILLVAMILVILSVTLLLARIGHANDLRTRARQAADAAALAAVTTVRDRAIAMIKNADIAPAYLPIGGDAEVAANDFARQNGSLVTSYDSGGVAAKVTVRTRECIKKEKNGGSLGAEDPCVRVDNDKGQDDHNQRTATATSAATIDMPTCFTAYYTPPAQGQWVNCNGQNASLMDPVKLAGLFKAHLSNSFNPDLGIPGVLDGSAPDLPPVTDPERKRNEELGRKLARDLKHWEGDEWHCLDQLWIGESGWNHHAKNASSGAYGIPQSLPASKMGSVGSDWADNPETQIKWGLNYIEDRYGTPCNAWQQWNNRQPHWY